MKNEAAKLTEWQLGLLKELTSIDSPTDDIEGNAAVAAVVKRELAAIGAEIEREVFFEGVGTHIVASVKAPAKGAPRIVMSGHLDTVFPRGSLTRFSPGIIAFFISPLSKSTSNGSNSGRGFSDSPKVKRFSSLYLPSLVSAFFM